MTVFLPYWLPWLEACETLGIRFSGNPESLRSNFEHFYEAMMAYNRKVNLTRITEPEGFLYRHLLDSLVMLPFIPEGATVADVGSGGGVPAIPLALARPDIRMTAIEATGKKGAFIEQAVQRLGLTDRVSVLQARSEDLARRLDYRERFDIVTARGVAALPVLLELCLPLVACEGLLLTMKGSGSYRNEVQAAGNALKVLKADIAGIHSFEHPKLVGSMLLVINKLENTPAAYPRAAGLRSKKPL